MRTGNKEDSISLDIYLILLYCRDPQTHPLSQLRIVMRALRLLIVLLGLLGWPLVASAQQTLTFDLASAAEHDTATLLPGRYQVSVISLAPKYDYTIAVSHGIEPIAAIPFAAAQGVAQCPNVIAATKALNDATKETEVPDLVKRVNDAIAQDAACTDTASARTTVRSTRRDLSDVYTLSAGEYIVVDVARIESGKATKRWTRRYTTGPRGEWRVTYGYAFPAMIRISGGHFNSDGQTYFAKQVGDTGSRYVVTAARRTQGFDAVPTIMFSYAPSDERDWTWNKVAAGLGTDFLTTPSMFVGTGVTYASNLTLSIGVSARREPVLRGQYTVGDTVRSNLTPDQLQENAFRLRPYFSATIRFDKNPFKKDTQSGSADQKAPDAKSTAGSGQTAGAPAPAAAAPKKP